MVGVWILVVEMRKIEFEYKFFFSQNDRKIKGTAKKCEEKNYYKNTIYNRHKTTFSNKKKTHFF